LRIRRDCKSALPPSRFCGYTFNRAVVVVEARPLLIATESIAMIIFGIIASFAALGALCWVLFNLAVFALPFFAGVSAGMAAVHSGAGPVGAFAIGIPVRRHAPDIATTSRRRRAAVCGSGGVCWLPRVPRDRCDDHALRSVAPVVRGSRKPDRRHHRISADLSATSPLRVQRAAQRPIPAGEIKPSARIRSISSGGDPGPGDPGGVAMLRSALRRADGPDVNWPSVSEGASGSGAMADRLDSPLYREVAAMVGGFPVSISTGFQRCEERIKRERRPPNCALK
jgi:hypothetical protein